MASLNVVCPNARRCPVKVTPGKLLREVLEEACLRQGYVPEEFELVHQKKRVDLSLPFRLSGLPNNAAVELSKRSGTGSGMAEIALQDADGKRMTAKFPLDATLADVLTQFSNQFGSNLLTEDGGLQPSCAYMNKQYKGLLQLETTSLRAMGLGQERALMRYNRVPISPEELAALRDEIEKELERKATLSRDFERNKVENARREQIEQERMRKFEEDQARARAEQTKLELERESQHQEESMEIDQPPVNSRDILPEAPQADPNSWSFDSGPFRTSAAPPPQSDRLTRLNNLLSNVNQSLSGQGANGIDNLVERLANDGRISIAPQENLYPLRDFKFPDHPTTSSTTTEQSDGPSKPVENFAPAADRETIVFHKSDPATTSHNGGSKELDENFFEVNVNDLRSMQKGLAEDVKREQQRALLPKSYIEMKNKERKLVAWRNTVIRIVLPDRRIIQGNFNSNEPASRVTEWIAETLADEKDAFSLSLALHIPFDNSSSKSLIDVNVAPACTMYLKMKRTREDYGELLRAELSVTGEADADQRSKAWLSENSVYTPWTGAVIEDTRGGVVRRANDDGEAPAGKHSGDILTNRKEELVQQHDKDVAADNGTNGIPLIPSDYGDIREAINNFVTVFDARYRNGGISAKSAPNFFHGALQDAVQQAFDPVGGGAQERRPLALYLHHDRSVAANIFPQILMSDAVSSLLRAQYVLWPWDITHPDHKNQLRDWMSIGSMDEVRQVFEFRTRNRDLFPMLLLIIKEKGTLKVAEYISGTDGKEVAVEKLMAVLDAYNQIRLNSMADEAARIERGRLLEEQRQEYEASLAADRARDEARQRAIREQQEAEEKRMQEEAEEENRRKRVEQLLPAEPAETETNLMQIKMRCPGGEQLMRRFRRAETLEMLLNYLDTKGYHTDKYKFFNADFPKKDITTLDKQSTFNDLKWPAREQIFVEEL
ncbi:unnamed protein product, partial [Mesorhabditis spiculigera]